jgi:hypothetical protein
MSFTLLLPLIVVAFLASAGDFYHDWRRFCGLDDDLQS